MYCVRDLFSEYHSIHTHEELNGVIQIFNLLYIRDAHLERALQKVAQLGSKDLTDYDVSHWFLLSIWVFPIWASVLRIRILHNGFLRSLSPRNEVLQ